MDKKYIRKHRHVIAGMIALSLGYFTPAQAAQAINYYERDLPWSCEWYWDQADKFFQHVWKDVDGYPVRKFEELSRAEKRAQFKGRLLVINYRTISGGVNILREKAWKSDVKRALAVVDAYIKGADIVGASWF